MRWLTPVIIFLVFAAPSSPLKARGDGDLSWSIRVSKRSPGPVELAWENRHNTPLHMDRDEVGTWMIYRTIYDGQSAIVTNFRPSHASIQKVIRTGNSFESWMINQNKRDPRIIALGIEDKPHGNYYTIMTDHLHPGELHVEYWNST